MKENISSHSHNHCHCCEGHTHSHDHDHSHGSGNVYGYITLAVSVVMVAIGLYVEHFHSGGGITPSMRTGWYLVAYLLVGWPVLKGAFELVLSRGSVFNEFTLMSIASIGAFLIGEHPEAVSLMILYTLGELLQDKAVSKARESISHLIDMRPEKVIRLGDGGQEEIHPSASTVGDTLRILPGERLCVDGTLVSTHAILDMSALTGESRPIECSRGEELPAGSIVHHSPIDIRVSRPYEESTLARILELVEHAGEKKPQTERFIRRFSRIYTPIVTGMAVLIVLLPWVYSLAVPSFSYHFQPWLYRGLVFLVTSCPCALIISVPLGFLGGIGAGSRIGILFKGAVYLDNLRKVDTLVADKTGTLTYGKFEVQELRHLHCPSSCDEKEAESLLLAAESESQHPIARAIVSYLKGQNVSPASLTEVCEMPGRGIVAKDGQGRVIAVGNARLMQEQGVSIGSSEEETCIKVHLCIQGKEVLVAILTDKVKEGIEQMVEGLRKRGVDRFVILSGDRSKVVEKVARQVGIEEYHADLLPQDKVREMSTLTAQADRQVAFVGDGLNDAPVMAISQIGIAMGGIGSGATIEAADVVIQSDNPMRIVQGMDISAHTHRIVVTNIIFALGFKLLVLILAALGFATLTLAIIADVGVSLVAVLNSLRALTYTPKDL